MGFAQTRLGHSKYAVHLTVPKQLAYSIYGTHAVGLAANRYFDEAETYLQRSDEAKRNTASMKASSAIYAGKITHCKSALSTRD